MNEHAKIKIPSAPTSVTTGAIGGSHKVYAAPEPHPDIRVPFRQIELSDPPEPPVGVYDASGPETAPSPRIGLAAGLAPVREAWIARRGYSAIPGRAVKPEDNGHVASDRLPPPFPGARGPPARPPP